MLFFSFPRYAIPSLLQCFLPALLFPLRYAFSLPAMPFFSLLYLFADATPIILQLFTLPNLSIWLLRDVMSYTETSQYIQNLYYKLMETLLKSYDHYKAAYRVGMITQINRVPPVVEPSM